MAIEITSFREFNKNTLQGFLTIRMTNIGLEIRDICLHEKDGKRWVSMPAKPYEKDGQTKYSYILDFYEQSFRDKFQEAVLAALTAHRAA